MALELHRYTKPSKIDDWSVKDKFIVVGGQEELDRKAEVKKWKFKVNTKTKLQNRVYNKINKIDNFFRQQHMQYVFVGAR